MDFGKDEQETSLVFDAETNEWIGYSCYSPHITKVLKLLGIDNVEAEYEDGRESPISIRFLLRSNQVSFRKGEKREMTEEQRKATAERLRKARENK